MLLFAACLLEIRVDQLNEGHKTFCRLLDARRRFRRKSSPSRGCKIIANHLIRYADLSGEFRLRKFAIFQIFGQFQWAPPARLLVLQL